MQIGVWVLTSKKYTNIHSNMITSSPILKSASSAQMFLLHGLLSQLKISAFPHHFRPQHGKSDFIPLYLSNNLLFSWWMDQFLPLIKTK